MNLRRDQRIQRLQTQSDWFQKEAADLAEERKKLLTKLEPLRNQITILETEVMYYKKTNSGLQAELEEVKIALKTTHDNCDQLLKIVSKQDHQKQEADRYA